MLLLALAASATMFACSALMPQRSEDLPYTTGTIERDAGGAVVKARLAEQTEIDGIPCTGWVHFRADGSLESADLAHGCEVSGRLLPRGTRVFLRADRTLKRSWLSHNLAIDGVRCEGGSMKVESSFHVNGKLASAFLSEDQEIQGVPCEASVRHPVTFDPEGRITGCRLSRPWDRGGFEFKRGTVLRFDETGRATPVP